MASEFTERRLAKQSKEQRLSHELRGLRESIQNGRSYIGVAATRADDMGLMTKHDGSVNRAHTGRYLEKACEQIDAALACIEADLTGIYVEQIREQK